MPRTQATAAATLVCNETPYIGSIPLPEASGATFLAGSDRTSDGRLLIVADSGHHGAALELHPRTGEVLWQSRLPMSREARDFVSDDLEGLSALGNTIYGLTSGGWMRHWQKQPDGNYVLSQEAYPVADRRARGSHSLICRSSYDTNCGRNYEGLCLHSGEGPCVGFAASKTDGVLYCLVRASDGQRLRIDPTRALAVTPPRALSGCHFEAGGDVLWVGANLFDGNRVRRITGWRALLAQPRASSEGPVVAPIDRAGNTEITNREAIVVTPDGALFRFSDTNARESSVSKFACE